MSSWTIDQVSEWLKKEGFEQFIPHFKDRKIDGASLLTLNNDTIRQILSTPDRSDTQNQRVIDQFIEKLYDWKIRYNVGSTDRKTETTSKESYIKNITLSTDTIGSNIKFFNNPSFRTHLQQYLSNIYNVECQIRLLETQEIYLTLNGIKQNVKTARETITSLFQSIQTKTYENEDTDQQMIYWSQHITSDLIIPVLQKIMDDQKFFTLWDKTAMFFGHFKVAYFTHASFSVSENQITQILNNEIAYIENLAIPNEKTTNLLETIDQYIFNKQNPELAIIHYKYPYKLDIKISLFGRKSLVKRTKKQLQSIINKHTIKTFQLKMNSYQHEYLLDHRLDELKDIEDEYKNDNVKIRIRSKEFSAPQYLIEKIKQKINALMFHMVICRYQQIGNSIVVTDHQNEKIQQIARYNNCRIDQIDVKTEMEVYSIPKALSPSANASNSIIEQSNELTSTLTMKKVSVSNGSIEIHLTNQSISLPRDITIISSPAGAAEEGIEYLSDNGYFEMRTGRKILFQRWSPMETADKKLKKSVEKFISSTLQSVTTCCSDAEKIGFRTNEWENIGVQQQQLVEYLINEVKQELEIRKIKWRILFMFNDKQMNLYREFYQGLVRLQTDQDGFAQFSCSVTTTQITLSTISTVYLNKCEKEMNTYINKNILADKILINEGDLKQWDQYTINAFYRYCLSRSVLPKIDLTTNLQIQLIGSVSDVEKSVEKYRLMMEILKQRSSLRIPPPIIQRTSVQGNNNRSNPVDRGSYNIYFSFCQHDEAICNRITTCLTGEGYFVCQSSSNTSVSQSLIDKSDVILIGFSEDYSKNMHSMQELNYAKSTRKKLIPFVIREMINDSSWFASLIVADLFYDVFNMEIDIEFKDDFNLEYDRLISTLLHHTKPGTTGKTYPQPTALPEINRNDGDYEKAAFGYQSLALQKLTSEQRAERQKKYQEAVTKKVENEKIENDDLPLLVASLHDVVDYLEAIIRGEDPNAGLSVGENNQHSPTQKPWQLDEDLKACDRQFLGCVKRWLEKAPNAIRGNIAPFTPTGDINDAVFIIPRSVNAKQFERVYEPFDHSLPGNYFSRTHTSGLYITNEQTHEYYQKLVESTKPMSGMDTTIKEKEIVWDIDPPNPKNIEEENKSEWKTPEEIRKLEELDDPNRNWTNDRNVEQFINQKIKNILEFKALCEKYP